MRPSVSGLTSQYLESVADGTAVAAVASAAVVAVVEAGCATAWYAQ